MNELWINIIGYTASICMIFGYLPQAITTIRTRDTDGIAMPTFCVIQGFALGNWPLVVTNVITTVCSAIIFGIKIYNDCFRKR